MCCFNTEEMAYFSVGINPLSSPINVYFCTARGPPIIFLINNTWAWKFTILTIMRNKMFCPQVLS